MIRVALVHQFQNEFPLSGIIRAPDGSRYTGESAKGGRHFYYRNRKLKKRFPVARIHGAVFSRLKEVVREGGLLEGIVSRFGGGGAGRSRFEGERRRLRAKIGRLGEVVDGFGDALKAVVLEKRDDLGEVVGTLKDERGKAERDIRKLAGDLARLDGEERGFDESLKGGGFRASAKLLLDNMEKMPALQLRKVLKVLMPKIVVVTGQGENTLEITYNLAGCGAKKPGILPAVSGIRTAEDESSTYTEDGGAHEEKVQLLFPHPYVVDKTRLSTVPKFKDRDVLRQKFLVEGRFVRQIAKEFRCAKSTVSAHLKKYGLKMEGPRRKGRANLAFGEKLVKNRVKPHNSELEVEKTILTMYQQEGLSPSSISRLLDAMKIPTKKGKRWSHVTVIRILARNEVYRASR